MRPTVREALGARSDAAAQCSRALGRAPPLRAWPAVVSAPSSSQPVVSCGNVLQAWPGLAREQVHRPGAASHWPAVSREEEK